MLSGRVVGGCNVAAPTAPEVHASSCCPLGGFQLVSDSTFQQGTLLSQVGYGLFAEGE